jgi:hypothetical protein
LVWENSAWAEHSAKCQKVEKRERSPPTKKMAATPPTYRWENSLSISYEIFLFPTFFFFTPVVYVLYKAAIEALWHLLSEDQMLNVKILGSLFSSLGVLPCVFSSAQKILSCQKTRKWQMMILTSFFFSFLDLIPPFISFFFFFYLLTFFVLFVLVRPDEKEE